MPARFFSRIQAKKTSYRLPKVFLSAAVLFFLILGNTITALAQEAPPRTIDDHLTLFGTNFNPTREEVLNAQASGIVYIGPDLQSNTDYDTEGLQEIITVVSLNIDPKKPRAWDMVAGAYTSFGLLQKHVLGLMDGGDHIGSFAAHVYQTSDDTPTGTITKEGTISLPAKTYAEDAWDEIGGKDEFVVNRKPLNHIVKFIKGAKSGYNFGSAIEDGYTDGDSTTIYALGIGTGAYLGGKIGAAAGAGVVSLLTDGPAVLAGSQRAVLYLDVSSANLEPGKKTFLDIWYLGSPRITSIREHPGAISSSVIYNTNGHYHYLYPAGYNEQTDVGFTIQGERLKDFGWDIFNPQNLTKAADHRKYPYFKIGGTTEFVTPKSLQEIQSNNASVQDQLSQVKPILTPSSDNPLPNCGILNGALKTSGTFLGCVAQIFYYGIYTPIQWFAGLFGKAFDFFLGYSLDDQSYRADFIVTAWKVIRDLTNIFFIIILVYTGLAAVFDIGNVSMKKVIPKLILSALLINFSLFVTRLVVDVSNIFARIFYNRIEVCTDGECMYDDNGVVMNSANGTGGYKPASVAIVSVFDPQRLFDPQNILSKESLPSALQKDDIQDDDYGAIMIGDYKNDNNYALRFIIVSAIAALIMFGVAMLFWKSMFFFLGRVIGIYIVMIFAPFAFLAQKDMPLVGKIPHLSWSGWMKELIDYALLAPVFVFFLFIVYGLTNSPFIESVRAGIEQPGDLIATTISIAVPLLLIYFMIKYGVEIAKSFSGFVGGMVQEYASKTAGYAAGAGLMIASAGTAYAGTTIGARAGRLIGNTRLGKWAARNSGNSRMARKVSNALDWSQKSSWDLRNTKAGGLMTKNALFNEMGLRTVGAGATAANKVGLAKEQFDGGAIGRAKRKQESKDMKDRITGFSYLTKENVQKVWRQKQDRLIGKEAMRGYLNETNDLFKAQTDTVKQQQEEIKDLNKKINTAQHDLDTNNKLSVDAREGIKNQMETDKKNLADTKEKMLKTQGKQLRAIDAKIRDKKNETLIRESDAYKKSYDGAKKASDGKFGKIDEAKDLENAMRRVYVENLRENSLWMKNDGQRKWLPAAGLSGSLAGMLTNFSAAANVAVGGITSAIFADHIKSEQDAIDAATKSFLKGYDKTKKSADKVWKYKETMKEADKLLKEEIAEQYGKHADDIVLDTIDVEEQERVVKSRVEELRAKMDVKGEEYKQVADRFRNGRASPDELKNASKEKKKAEDRYNSLKDIWKNRRDAEEGIAKEEAK